MNPLLMRLNNSVLFLSSMGAVLLLYSLFTLSRNRTPWMQLSTHDDHIPNIAHYVYVLADPSSDLSFTFEAVLSVYAASRYWQPDAIYLHTNAPTDALERARNGASGKWTQLLFQVPNFHVVEAAVPTHANNGREISHIEHKTDFVRVVALKKYGGVYLDFDVHPLLDVKPLRESGFQSVAGRQLGGGICSGVFMNKPGSRMVELWEVAMHAVYDPFSWDAHAIGALTAVGDQLVSSSREMLIMERDAFAPGSWNEWDVVPLLEVHNDEPSSLDKLVNGHLPEYEKEQMTQWPMPATGDKPSWAWNWSKTYMLHAFHHDQAKFNVPGFEQITPRYILERRSNLARAIYPVARDLYERGLIGIDDPYKYP
jgi:hypothetical protein